MLYEKISDNPAIFRIPVPFSNFKLESTNCYAVESEGDWLLVDTGAPSDQGFEHLMRTLAEIGFDAAHAQYFLTHLHLDHAGLVDRVVAKDAPLFLNERDYRYTETDLASDYARQLQDRLCEEGFAAEAEEHARTKRAFASFFTGDRDLRFVSEGDTICVGSVRFEVVPTPGHTPGHHALWDPASRTLISGDHILFIISPNLGLSLPDGDSVADYLASLERVRRLEPERVLHSHGPLRDDFDERIVWLDEHTRRRVERIRKAIEDTPGRTAAEIITSMKWNVPYDRWADIPGVQRLCVLENALAALNHLILEGEAVRQRSNGLFRYTLR